MLTVKEWEEKQIKLGDEVFLPVFEKWLDTLSGPYLKVVGYRGVQSGQMLHSEFGNILEI